MQSGKAFEGCRDELMNQSMWKFIDAIWKEVTWELSWSLQRHEVVTTLGGVRIDRLFVCGVLLKWKDVQLFLPHLSG